MGAASLENPISVTMQNGKITYKTNFELANLLRNSSVENDEYNDVEPDYWYLKRAEIPTDQQIWSTDAHTRNKSLEIHITRNDTLSRYAFAGRRQMFDLEYPTNYSGYASLERGESYKLRGWGQSEGAEPRMIVVMWDSNYSALGSAGSGFSSPTWTQSR